VKEFSIYRFCIHGIIPQLAEKRVKNLLIAFCDRYQDVLALGVIEEFYPRDGRVVARTPLRTMQQVNSIQFGTLAIKATGEELKYKK
jgi:polynucleotide 5'-kinase involved in rRNA processing